MDTNEKYAQIAYEAYKDTWTYKKPELVEWEQLPIYERDCWHVVQQTARNLITDEDSTNWDKALYQAYTANQPNITPWEEIDQLECLVWLAVAIAVSRKMR